VIAAVARSPWAPHDGPVVRVAVVARVSNGRFGATFGDRFAIGAARSDRLTALRGRSYKPPVLSARPTAVSTRMAFPSVLRAPSSFACPTPCHVP
jgi:hypothetical protein